MVLSALSKIFPKTVLVMVVAAPANAVPIVAKNHFILIFSLSVFFKSALNIKAIEKNIKPIIFMKDRVS